MAANQAPQAHRVRLRELATGRVFDAWPVDAREMLTHEKGGFERVDDETPLGIPKTPPGEPEATHGRVETPVAGSGDAGAATASIIDARVVAREALEKKSYKELQELAGRSGVNRTQKQAALIEALLPLVLAKTVSLEELPKLALDPVQFPHATPE